MKHVQFLEIVNNRNKESATEHLISAAFGPVSEIQEDTKSLLEDIFNYTHILKETVSQIVKQGCSIAIILGYNEKIEKLYDVLRKTIREIKIQSILKPNVRHPVTNESPLQLIFEIFVGKQLYQNQRLRDPLLQLMIHLIRQGASPFDAKLPSENILSRMSKISPPISSLILLEYHFALQKIKKPRSPLHMSLFFKLFKSLENIPYYPEKGYLNPDFKYYLMKLIRRVIDYINECSHVLLLNDSDGKTLLHYYMEIYEKWSKHVLKQHSSLMSDNENICDDPYSLDTDILELIINLGVNMVEKGASLEQRDSSGLKPIDYIDDIDISKEIAKAMSFPFVNTLMPIQLSLKPTIPWPKLIDKLQEKLHHVNQKQRTLSGILGTNAEKLKCRQDCYQFIMALRIYIKNNPNCAKLDDEGKSFLNTLADLLSSSKIYEIDISISKAIVLLIQEYISQYGIPEVDMADFLNHMRSINAFLYKYIKIEDCFHPKSKLKIPLVEGIKILDKDLEFEPIQSQGDCKIILMILEKLSLKLNKCPEELMQADGDNNNILYYIFSALNKIADMKLSNMHCGYEKILKVLIEHAQQAIDKGADLYSKNKSGQTPYEKIADPIVQEKIKDMFKAHYSRISKELALSLKDSTNFDRNMVGIIAEYYTPHKSAVDIIKKEIGIKQSEKLSKVTYSKKIQKNHYPK